ncbi:MAG: phenylalanine--tRNA ligase subunit beta, partial [Lachnospiraceae bacterium]|nr:phenylalanine--tRNA ligase subunit beta [Lachnospiraceae bacterium]
MNTPISWIKAYVPDLDCTVQEYVDKMTLSGSHVENAVYLDKNLEKIVVGQIEKIEKHPDADKLVVCQVNVGNEVVQIVTGAPNVFKGAKVPVVLDGGRVAGGHDGSPNPENGIKIKKGKLRGVPSCGMMCSIEELGSSREMYPEAPENGIYIFDEKKDVKPGDDAVEALGLRDAVVEFEITSNRVDCFSMIGMAREAAATFEKPFYPPEVKETGNNEDVNDYISVEVKDTDLCPRYTARVVKNIKLAPSPEWMQRRLAAMGIRPINNIVDITNYVMEEYGQPMHAYDLDTIRGNKIVVKRASDGEVYTTLDGQERNLDHDVLMINDAEGPVGIAGIMGGENSMVTDDIKTMLFEAATFDGTNIRLSSKRIGMRTDASGKFEKGLDPENALEAINRACQLVEELGAGEVVGGVVDVYPNPVEDVTIPFEPDKYNKLLGTDISREQMLKYFERLDIGYDEETNLLAIPSFRQDLRCSADIAEEVARFFGYDNIPTTLPKGESTIGKISEEARVEEIARTVVEQNGFCGGMCYSFE